MVNQGPNERFKKKMFFYNINLFGHDLNRASSGKKWFSRTINFGPLIDVMSSSEI